MEQGQTDTDLVAGIFDSKPMPRWQRALSHIAWGIRHPYWALCLNLARLGRVRRYVLDTTPTGDFSPMHHRLVRLTSSHDELLDALWEVIPRRDGWPDVTPEFRGRVLSLVGSLNEPIYWVREREPGLWYAEECEAGTGAWGYSGRDALENYWAGTGFDKPPSPDVMADLCARCGQPRSAHVFTHRATRCVGGRGTFKSVEAM